MRRAVREKKKSLPQYTYLGCPLTRNKSPWCFRLCAPDVEGKGRCGRIAPHTLKGRTQLAIEAHKKKKKLEEHCGILKQAYATAEANRLHAPQVILGEGTAEIIIPIESHMFDAAGAVDASMCFKALYDAALLATGTVIEKRHARGLNFTVYFTRPFAGEALFARGQFMGMSGDQYLAEAALSDLQGREIARGNGSFAPSAVKLGL